MKPSGTHKGSKKNVHDPKIIITGLFRKKSSEVGNVSRAFSEAVQSRTIKNGPEKGFCWLSLTAKEILACPETCHLHRQKLPPETGLLALTIFKGSFQ